MTSIVNGLFSGRSGIASHGTAIAVIGDNISNSSTLGYKSARAEFEDLVAGGQAAGRVIGTGSSASAVSTIFQQGTLEFTNRSLDMAIDGNGFFTVQSPDGSRFYTRAGNFKIDSAGFITTQGDMKVLGFPANGSGALDQININNVSQESASTSRVTIRGNLDRTSDIGTPPPDQTFTPATLPAGAVSRAGQAPYSTTTYDDLAATDPAYSTVVEVFDSLGASHTVTFYFWRTDSDTFNVRGFVNSEEVDPAGAGTASGLPRLVFDSGTTGDFDMDFATDGTRSNAPAAGASDIAFAVPWNNGSTASAINVDFSEFTSYATRSNIDAVTQNGKGIGAVTSINIEKNGDIFALLSNGQSSVIGTVGLVNFSNPEGLTRIGNQLLQQSASSGEPIVGTPLTGTLGGVQSGAVELSTVDIADQFVKLITLQRGFQANSRIITTINQLLNELIQLA